MTERLYSWVRLSDTAWEHEPSGTKLLWDDGWCVRFPSTTAVAFSADDAEAMWRIMVGAGGPAWKSFVTHNRQGWLSRSVRATR